jgi:hypothetical protein
MKHLHWQYLAFPPISPFTGVKTTFMNAILCRILLSPSKESIIYVVEARMLSAGYEWLAVV